MIANMNRALPLPTLLSRALVAFTIEFDNEAEHQMLHRTTRHGAKAGSPHAPWLVSMVMWSNCMQFFGEQALTVRDLERLARTKTNLAGMERWGYVVVEPDPADRRPKPPRSAWLVRATVAGRRAQDVWRPLFGGIEERWRKRFGVDATGRLRESLRVLAAQFEMELPDCLPILGYGLWSRGTEYEPRVMLSEDETTARLNLPALLSQVLLAFALDFEAESDLSLAIGANVIRVLDEKGVRVRDLPLLTGVSKEAIATALSFLAKRGYAAVETDTSSRTKTVRLTAKGRKAQEVYRERLDSLEERWLKRHGKSAIRALRDSLEPLAGDSSELPSPLLLGLEPYPDGWRAAVPKPTTLPHYPMVLHRGGFPDGS